MNAKDLLNNSTIVAMIPSEALAVAVETGAVTDLLGVGRKVLVVVNAGVPATGGLANIIIQESNDPNFAIAGTETLDAAMTIDQKTLVIQTGEGVNLPLYDFDLLIESEIVTVTKRVGDTCYIRRAQYGTTAATHADDTAVTLSIRTLHTFAELSAATLVEADLTPKRRYIRAVATVTVEVFTLGIDGIVYLEREIPSGV